MNETPCDHQLAMSRNEGRDPLLAGPQSLDELESQSLFTDTPDGEADLVIHPAPVSPSPISPSAPSPAIAQPAPDGQRRTPRTTNRVRFDLDDGSEGDSRSDRHARVSEDSSWLDDEDYARADHDRSERSGRGPMMPLLTDMEAPSVTLATSEDYFPEEHLESARPRSGMRMAFMNMANSIIGAGIIGQSYALRQSGMMMGIILLTALTVAVDWTIRLIVVNSKLSGADSFQATMQHCFGRSGLIAISIAQWAFAYGGMIAFCIIVGDTIPHVLTALFPSLRDMAFLWLLTDRRAIIVLFVMGISYPLSMYRDIAKVRFDIPASRITKADKSVVGESIDVGIDKHDSHRGRCDHPSIPRPSRNPRRCEGLALGEFRIFPGCWCNIIRCV